jgi:hypothetical protein
MRFIIAMLAAVLLNSAAYAQSLMETQDEARQRHSAENYQQYERNNNSAPLGGYNERLGDSAPRGTERPGYVSPQPYGNDYSGGNQQRNNAYGR